MGVFDEVKERVTAREVMERAGIVFNRNNMCRCPFHQDKTASMKVKPTDKKYFCFGCGEKGDAIDFVAKYYNRSPREAAMQIADEFGIIYDSSVRSPPKPVRREKSPMQILEETKTKTYRVLSDYLHLLKEWERNFRPESMEKIDERYTEFIHTVQETQVAQQSADISKKRRHLATAQKRAGELEKLICKIYEDNALGKLPDTRYKALDAQYAKEQDALEIEIAELEKAVTGYEQSQKSAEKFIALIDKYENFDTLTNTMLNEFVEKILVHERSRKGSQDTTQEIEIYFNFLGRYIPPSLQPVPLTPEEQEELRKREERKDRLHQNYLKRKASGAQKRYEDKIKAKKKAEMDAKKALIRAEDMKKGVFSTIGQLPKEEPRKGSIAASAAV